MMHPSVLSTSNNRNRRTMSATTKINNDEKPSALVVMATGKMGRGITKAFLDSKRYHVFGTSRKASTTTTAPEARPSSSSPSPSTTSNSEETEATVTTTLLSLDWNDVYKSMRKCLHESKASVVILMQASIISKSPQKEIQHGKEMIDACMDEAKASHIVKHIIFCGNMDSSIAPEDNQLVKPKYYIEKYLEETFEKANKADGLDDSCCCYSILGTCSFYENFDDPTVHNPLKSGRLADLYLLKLPIPHVSTLDIGKAAVAMADHPQRWNAQKLDTVVSIDTGEECAEALSISSGIPCTYHVAVPYLILRFVVPQVYSHVRWVMNENGFATSKKEDDTTSIDNDYNEKIRKFRQVVPDAISGPKEWFDYLGRWSDGTKFQEDPAVETASRQKSSASYYQFEVMSLQEGDFILQQYRTEFGCGYYNASISLFHNDVGSSPKLTCQNKTIPSHLPRITLELFWTSKYRNYHNQMHDRVNAFTIRRQNLNRDKIHSLVGQGRIDYLARHLDVLPGFPLDLELPVNAFVVEDGTTTAEEASNNVSAAASLSSDNAINNVALPNCSEVPIEEWLPVGVRAPADGSPKTGTWQFASSKCRYVEWNLEDLYYWLSGLKILYLGDSHQGYELEEYYQLVCPGAGPSDRSHIGRFIGDGFECPQKNISNPFIYGSQMFRGILNQDSTYTDTDGVAKPMREVQPKACQKFLGLGAHNVTIVMTPTWIFVYETEEGLLEYVQSMKDTLIMCRGLYPTEFENHIILLQSPTAADVRPAPGSVPADMWRQNHNFREDAFTKTLYQELSPYVDGIIPAFEFTLARNWKLPTRDGIHLTGGYYLEIFHLQVAAIISAMKSRGWNLPLFAHDDPKARWFKKDSQATA